MSFETADLARFYPLDSLRPENLEYLAKDSNPVEHARGELLFEAGQTDEVSIFLLAGTVRGEYPDGRVKTISANSVSARYALGDLQPRKFTCVVESMVATVIRFDRRYMEKILTWDQLTRQENFRQFDPAPDANRWVFRLLQNPALHKLPTGNIERMFTRFEPIRVRRGEVIIRQGDAPDYFYVIKEGTCAVSKETETGQDAVVAYLVRGDSFGEDALLSNTARNATVTMMKDGVLMRLSKQNFAEVLKPPVVEWLTPGQASIQARKGAGVIDVRLEEEHQERAIKGSVNVPLYRLREHCAELDKTRAYIVYCNTGERSAAAAFILSKLGFKVYALQGGLSAMLKSLKPAVPARQA